MCMLRSKRNIPWREAGTPEKLIPVRAKEKWEELTLVQQGGCWLNQTHMESLTDDGGVRRGGRASGQHTAL